MQIWPPDGVGPWSRTDSGGHFDRAPDVLFLELLGAQVAERRMQPLAIAYLVDEVREVCRGILEAFVAIG